MDEAKEKIIATIQKLLNITEEKGASSNEAKIAQEKAVKLMEMHQISMRSIIINEKESAVEKAVVESTGNAVRMRSWEGALSLVVGKAFDCRPIVTNSGSLVEFYGFKGDLEMCTYFFSYLRRHASRSAKKKFNKMGDRNAFCLGFTIVAGERLKELYKKVEESSVECRDLMVMKKDMVNKRVEELFPKLSSLKGPANLGSRNAYEHGRYEGGKVSLGKPVGHNGRQERIN